MTHRLATFALFHYRIYLLYRWLPISLFWKCLQWQNLSMHKNEY